MQMIASRLTAASSVAVKRLADPGDTGLTPEGWLRA